MRGRTITDLTGKRFGRLTTLKRAQNGKHGEARWECNCDCGKVKPVSGSALRSGATQSCGCLLRERTVERLQSLTGELNPGWKGGKMLLKGYVIVLKPEHPFAQKGGYILEHRVVMEDYLGRYLLKNETVHHKNGNKTDNRIENLELWKKNHPPGQREGENSGDYFTIKILRRTH